MNRSLKRERKDINERQKLGYEKSAGKVAFVCGVISLVLSASFLVMGLMGVAVVQENSGGIGNIIGIAMAAFFIHHGRSMLKDDN